MDLITTEFTFRFPFQRNFNRVLSTLQPVFQVISPELPVRLPDRISFQQEALGLVERYPGGSRVEASRVWSRLGTPPREGAAPGEGLGYLFEEFIGGPPRGQTLIWYAHGEKYVISTSLAGELPRATLKVRATLEEITRIKPWLLWPDDPQFNTL